MATSVFDSPMWGGQYRDPDLAQLFTDSADLRAMLLAEGALALAQGDAGLIPKDAATGIHRAAMTVALDPAALAAGTAAAGVPVPAFVAAFRKALPDRSIGPWIHFGATSQDIMDTSLVLRLRRVVEIYDERLSALIATLGNLAEAEAETVMAARTRGQNATPTTLGARVAAWGMPLLRHRARLAELRPRLLVVSLGGASGTLAAMDGKGPEVAAGMAKALGLGVPDMPWHSARDTLVELGNWAAMLAGMLGKMGADILFQSQSDLAELRAGAAGGSSTMPHKQNPVGAELLVQLGRAAPAQLAGLHQAMIFENERDGAAWGQEWLTLPPLLTLAGRGLLSAQDLASTLVPDRVAMTRPFAAHGGVMFAEACSFALAAHMPRPEAQAMVKTACATALDTGRPLREVLEAECDAPLDWEALFDPLKNAGEAPRFARRFAALARGEDG
ncbi:class-II fumarase/aspartase family protein [Oceanibium sediminis]|uniref:class-II fumarase/aspartase family protein n=1 Tax=Oceanibium sediminis TaxID=2026339 RepID=UPI000DD409EB|nr:adenylosuccinate lyase family protein [Oceanibium sediminis]